MLNLTLLEAQLVCPRTDTEPQEPGRTDNTHVAGLGNCQTLLLVYYPFGQAPVAPYPFVDILTGTPQVSGSTHFFMDGYGGHPLSWPRLLLEVGTLCCPK